MHLTRDSLAEYLGVTAAHIGNLEKGKTQSPSYFFIEAMARFFGVTCYQLVWCELLQNPKYNEMRKDQILRRIEDNFDDTELELVELMIDSLTRKQAQRGRFRAISKTGKLKSKKL